MAVNYTIRVHKDEFNGLTNFRTFVEFRMVGSLS